MNQGGAAVKRSRIIAMFACVAVFVGACGGDDGTGDNGGTSVVQVAVFGPMTGDGAVTGEQLTQGAELAATQINDGGGIAGGPLEGATVEIVPFDDQNDPQQSVTNARQIVGNEELIAAVGAGYSDVSIAVAPVFERAGMTFMSTYGSANTILEPAKANVFVVPPTFDAYGYSIAYTMADDGVTSAGILHLTGVYGELIAEYTAQGLTEQGITVTDSQPFNFGDNDFRTQIARLQASDPEALVIVGLVDSNTLILRQAREAGWDIPVYDPGGISFNQSFLDLAEEDAEGIVGNTPSDPERATQATQDLFDAWEEAYGTRIVPDAGAFTYEAVLAIGEALAAGASGREDLASHIHEVSIEDTGVGPLSFSAEGARLGARLWIFQIQDGQFVFRNGYAQRGVFDLEEIPLEH
jgi:ABC-type branched-subunit amino acid transport system substrate-binding protein